MRILIVALVLVCCSCVAQGQGPLPVKLPQGAIGGGNSESCPSAQVLNQAKNSTKEAIKSIIRDTVVPALNSRSAPCPCGGSGPWRRIAHLNMSDPNQQCPASWTLHTSPVRACGRLIDATACDSAVFANSQAYSRVCGRVIAVQKGAPEAFIRVVAGNSASLEDVYIDGVSLTHGAAGSRQHIWSFAAAEYESETNPSDICPCINPNIDWPYQLPSFIGNNYFCDTGSRGHPSGTTVFPNNPLWDGEGCGPINTCCQFNTPPWFCTTLPQPTRDNIELRICSNGNLARNENILVQLVDIYVM